MQAPARVTQTWKWITGLPTSVVDAVLAAVFVVAGLVSTSQTAYEDVVFTPRDTYAYVLILLATLPYAVRRKAPLPVFLVSACAVVLLTWDSYAEGVLPLVVLFGAYTVGAHRPVREAVVAAFGAVALLVAVYFGDSPNSNFDAGVLAMNLITFLTAILIGWNVQSRRLRLEALELGQEEAARAAAADERLRIAQELHDVVAHSLGVIAVQAGVGLHMIDHEPQEARKALENISSASRSSLAEIRRLLGVVRDRDDAPDYAPAPSLADLPRLVRDLEATGLSVDLRVDGSTDGLPPGVELAAYRIVQEALTNALRHAQAHHIAVRIGRSDGAVDITVTDDGRGGDPDHAAAGHGLVGMRERAACYGGTVEVGPLAEGGWRVATRLRYDAAGVS